MAGFTCWKCGQWMPPYPENTITVTQPFIQAGSWGNYGGGIEGI